MKKIILSTLVLSLAFAVQAQEIPERKGERPPMMERKKHHRGMEFQKLNLTEDQKAKFKTQNESFRKQMEELKKNDNITVKDWKAKAENIRKEHKNNTQNILTSEQKAQVEKMKAEGKVKHEEMAKKMGDRMKTTLGLTDEQSAKLQKSRAENGEKMKTIRESKSLSDEQKKEQMKEMMKKQKETMKSILTEEQMKKLKETKHKRPEGERRKPEMKQTI
jgi:Spy/CpxP family protein refolding chaperone